MRMGFIGPVQDRTDLFPNAFRLVGFDLFDVSISGIVSFRIRKSKSNRRENLRSGRVGFYLACTLSDKRSDRKLRIFSWEGLLRIRKRP